MVILAVILSTSTSENVNRAEKLFIEYGDFIRSIISYNIKNKDLTEDIYQDLFIYFIFRPIPADVKSHCEATNNLTDYIHAFKYEEIDDRWLDNNMEWAHQHRWESTVDTLEMIYREVA